MKQTGIFLAFVMMASAAWAHDSYNFDGYPQLDYWNSGLRSADDPDDIVMQLVISNPKIAHTLMFYGLECAQAKTVRIERVREVFGEKTYDKVNDFRLEPGVTLELSPPKYRVLLEDVKKADDGSVAVIFKFAGSFPQIGVKIAYPTEVMQLNKDREPAVIPAGK